VRVGQRDVHALQRQRVRQLPPVGGDHVGGRGQAGGAAELGHHLAAGEAVFGAAGVFGIGHHAAHALAQADGVLQQPAAVGVERDAGLGKRSCSAVTASTFLVAAQHAALELEVVEAVASRAASARRTTASGVIAVSWRRRNQSLTASGSLA
jgi:hypothetical protein